jgi:hypothetical protein
VTTVLFGSLAKRLSTEARLASGSKPQTWPLSQ